MGMHWTMNSVQEYMLQMTPSLRTRYPHAIMAFKNLDLRALNVWEPGSHMASDTPVGCSYSWQAQGCRCFPEAYISIDLSEARRQKQLLRPDKLRQLVAVSYEGCKALSKSLYAVTYIVET
jgi:hypothetical protein